MNTLECAHRHVRLVVDIQHERYQYQCRECLLTTGEAPTGLSARSAWQRMLRGGAALSVIAYGFKHAEITAPSAN